jgi:hypothetical protein
MSLTVDLQYLMKISHLVRNFKKKADYIYVCSCPICGDSKKHKYKTRGYILRGDRGLYFKCHNCGESRSFGKLIQHLDPAIYKEYVYESYLEQKGVEKSKKKPDKKLFKKKSEYKPAKPSVLVGCPSIASLGPDHPARSYIESRKIPTKFFEELYWTDDFPTLVNKIDPDNTFNLKKEGRIIIPFLDRNHQLIAIQGRTLDKNNPIRYITIKAFEDAPRIFGMHRLAKVWKRIYAVEGPFDSLFLPNCVALAGSDIPAGFPANKTVIVYDNEPRKAETCDKMAKAIERGYRVCIWPDTIKQKDINLMVLDGHKPNKIRELIDINSFVGLEANFRLRQWRKD